MKYLQDLVTANNDKLVRHNETVDGRKYVSVFEYSTAYGGTYDSQKFYNNYVVEVKGA